MSPITEHDAQVAMTELNRFPEYGLTGRRKILTNVAEITAENVKNVLANAMTPHLMNKKEISYLWDVYRGKQDIRLKEKFERTNINNKICINRANQLVTFKTAYLLGAPVTYVSTGNDDLQTQNVVQLNKYMQAEDKASKDKEIVDWMHICGVSERLTLTDEMAGTQNEAPYYIYTIDPRDAFVIYSSRIGQRPMAGVIIQKDENDQDVYTVYTDKECFTITGDTVTSKPHILGGVPLVEYVNNEARMGAIELILSICNAINDLESHCLDSIQDFVNGFDVFQNCKPEEGTYGQLSIGGQALCIQTVVQGMEAKVYRVASELNQSGVQQRIDSLMDAFEEISGMPNRNQSNSASDTGQGAIYRDGWEDAESRACDSETLFKRSEKAFLKIVLNICRVKAGLDMKLSDLDINFPRKRLNNLQSKIQGLCELLANEKVHPMDAYNAMGDIFGDKMAAYRRGLEWAAEQEAKEQEAADAEIDREREAIANEQAVSTRGQNNQGNQQDGAETEESG